MKSHFFALFPFMAGMIQQARRAVAVDWTIPAPWLIAIALGGAVQCLLVIWKTGAILVEIQVMQKVNITHVEALAKKQEEMQHQVDTNTAFCHTAENRLNSHDLRIRTIEMHPH